MGWPRSALAEWQDGELAWRGKVGTGFDAVTLHALLRRLEPLREGAAAIDGAPKDIRWVRPVLTARIHYANRTADNALRHAVFRGLREVELTASDARTAPAADLRRRSRLGDDHQSQAAAVRPFRRDQA